jgi:ubiquinone/menaquinone biosynthesis C-methylase UbiE
VCFDRAADVYDTTRRVVQPEAIKALVEELSDCSSVLELGVGTGRLAVPLMERGLRVVGVDLSRKMLDQGRAKGLNRLVMGDVCRLPFRPKSVDGVLAVHVLHLIDGLRDVVAEAAAVARKKLVTIMERRYSPDRTVTWAYDQAVRRRGVRSARRWVQPELGIGMIVPPRRFEILVRYEERETAEAALAALERRLWAHTWDVPDDVHREVLAELSGRFAGTDICQDVDVCLLSWDVADFTEAALERVGA